MNMLDRTTLELFGRLSRETGDPSRHQVYTVKEIESFIRNTEGKNDQIFISLYPSNFLVDKLYHDCDYGSCVFEDFVSLFEYSLKNKLNPIPIITGLKGSRKEPRYHLYNRLTPKIYGPDAKLLLYKATYRILTDVFGEISEVIENQHRHFRTKERIISPDPCVVGDLKRLVRIPQTERISNPRTFCTYLPYDFTSWSQRELLKWCFEKHVVCYPKIESRLFLTDSCFSFEFSDMKHIIKEHKPFIKTKELSSTKLIKPLLRPCVWNQISKIHPDHLTRVIATVDLFSLGFNEDEIVDYFSKLGWQDFDESVTRHYIGYCKRYKPYSCSKLRGLGIPKQCSPCIG